MCQLNTLAKAWAFLPICFFSALLIGCGESGPKLNTVSGKVTYDGKPLTRGSISLRADKSKGNSQSAEPFGEIKGDGTYSLMTGKTPGAPLGKYIVLITASEDIDPKNASAAPKPIVPRKYGDPDNPILRMEIVEKANPDQYDFNLKK